MNCIKKHLESIILTSEVVQNFIVSFLCRKYQEKRYQRFKKRYEKYLENRKKYESSGIDSDRGWVGGFVFLILSLIPNPYGTPRTGKTLIFRLQLASAGSDQRVSACLAAGRGSSKLAAIQST